jgi:hypothetical protein
MYKKILVLLIVFIVFENQLNAQSHPFKQFSIQFNPILTELLVTNDYSPYFDSFLISNYETSLSPIISITYMHPISTKWQLSYDISYRTIENYLYDIRDMTQFQYGINIGKMNSSQNKHNYTYLGLGVNFSKVEKGDSPNWSPYDTTPFGKYFFGLEFRGGKSIYYKIHKNLTMGYGLKSSLGYYNFYYTNLNTPKYRSFYINIQLSISIGMTH